MKRKMQIPVAVALVGILLLGGCDQSTRPPQLPVFRVTGELFVDGRPASGAQVFFRAQPAIPGLGTIPVAIVASDGSFAPSTYGEQDGLPAGEYDLAVIWPKITVVEGEERTGPDQLGGKYSKPNVPVAHVTVGEGSLVIPRLELKRN
ncbi:MAG TPA: hypothetical protein VHY91_10895 [Pirellulales bacterium]|nr:hypothetical protein [Pirellulales bacterium]